MVLTQELKKVDEIAPKAKALAGKPEDLLKNLLLSMGNTWQKKRSIS